jgi:uncharacterized membrane protein YjgN (DUF898 family)
VHALAIMQGWRTVYKFLVNVNNPFCRYLYRRDASFIIRLYCDISSNVDHAFFMVKSLQYNALMTTLNNIRFAFHCSMKKPGG